MDNRTLLTEFDIKKSFAPLVGAGFFKENDLVPFEYDETKFSIINAWWMADFSRLVYVRKKTTVRTKLKDAGYSNIKFFENKETGTQAFITHNDQTVVLCFRGTEIDTDFRDILIDARFWRSDSKVAGKVHNGFKEALDSVWDDIKAYLEKIVTDDHIVWFTGHSLGGALATLASARYTPTATYTFGSPKVGSRKFNRSIKSPVYRVAKSRDIVTRVPPIGYKATGDLYFIDSKGKILKNPLWITRFRQRLGGGEYKLLWLAVKMLITKSPWDLLLSYLHDHSPYNYSVYMWNNIGEYEEKEEVKVDIVLEYYPIHYI